jgi:cytosine permease
MSKRFESKAITDYEREPVPQDKRKGWGKLSLVWIAGIVALSAIVLGGTLGSGMTLSQSIIASLVGTFILAILSAACSIVGARTGLSTALVSSFALGKYGSYAVSAVIAIALFGWFGVQLNLFSVSLQNVLMNTFSINIDPIYLVLLGGLAMSISAIIGYKAIEKLSMVAVPLLAILLVSSLVRVLNGTSMAEVAQAPLTSDPLSMGVAISLIIGSLATGAIIGPDISRYAKSTKDAVISSFVGYFVGFSIVLIISSILAKATTQVDIVQIMLTLGWGSGALVILIIAQWTTNDNNLYSSALGFSVIFRKVPKFYLSIAAGLIGTLLAVVGIYDSFIPFLSFLSVLIPPIGGIYVADFIINRKNYAFEKLANVKSANFLNIGIWVIASLVAFLTTPAPNGFGVFTLTGASGFDAFIVAFILQIFASKMQGENSLNTTPETIKGEQAS